MERESGKVSFSSPKLGLVLLLSALLIGGCSSCTTTVDPAIRTCQPVAEATPLPPLTGSGALIVTDISGSMNGFAIPSSVKLFTLHSELERSVRNGIASAEPNPLIKRCYLGVNLECQKQLNLRDLDNPGTYSAKESRLDLFMLSAKKDGDNKDNKPESDPLDPYRIAVLVTDGMEASASNASSAAPCMAGADPDCMAHLLVERAQHGYGIWMAVLLLPFKGNHYAERPMDNTMWQKTQQHVAALAEDPYFKGVKFNAKRTGTNVPFEYYQFEGVKPIMVLVLSKDLQAGRAVMQQFTESIKREAIAQPAEAVYSIELAPLSTKLRQIAKIGLPPTAQAEGARPLFSGRKGGIYDYLIECDRNGSAALSATSEERPGAQLTPYGVTAKFDLVPFGKPSLGPNNLSIKPLQDGSFQLRVSCQQVKQGSYETCLNLQTTLAPDAQSDAFWKALHADNMYEAPERLYGLNVMVQKVLDAVTHEPRIMDRVRFRVEVKD
jgi:hypothetical protein